MGLRAYKSKFTFVKNVQKGQNTILSRLRGDRKEAGLGQNVRSDVNWPIAKEKFHLVCPLSRKYRQAFQIFCDVL